MKRIFSILLVFCALIQSGCTDIRSRRYCKLLAINGYTKTAQTLCYDEDSTISASYNSPLLLPDALSQASGWDISLGHLAILVIQNENLAFLRDLLVARLIAPTCPVLLTDQPPEIDDNTNISDRLDAAVRTGLIPLRTVGDIVGDLQTSTRTTLLPYLQGDTLRLAVCDESHVLSVISEDAARGAALLCGRWESCSFVFENTAISLKSCKCHINLAETAAGLSLSVHAQISVKSGDFDIAKAIVTKMLTAFLREAVCANGTDTCNLQEIAAKSNIPMPSAAQLQTAEISVTVQ